MELITYFDTNLRKDQLHDIQQHANYIAVYTNDFELAFHLFGKNKTYILMRDWQDSTQISEDLSSEADIIFQITEDMAQSFRNKWNIMFFNHATTWEQLNRYADLGAAAIIIDAPLTFEMQKINKWKKSHSANIFAIADSDATTDIQHWFALPDTYHEYLDIIDAVCVRPSLIHAYAHKLTPFRISQILPSINWEVDLNPTYLPLDFTEKRMNCGQRCQEPDGQCSYCIRAAEMVQQLERIKPNGN